MNFDRHRLLGIMKDKLSPVFQSSYQEIIDKENKYYENHVLVHKKSHKVTSLVFFTESHSYYNKLKESYFYETQGLKWSSAGHAWTRTFVACVLPWRRWHVSNPMKKGFCMSLQKKIETEENWNIYEKEDVTTYEAELNMN